MQIDKLFHVIAGIALAFFGGFLTQRYASGALDIHILSAGFACAVFGGVLKEVYDWVSNRLSIRRGQLVRHTPDRVDIIYTVYGGCFGMAAISAVMLAVWLATPLTK